MIVYFSIGTNLGDRTHNLSQALLLLHQRVGEQLACSSVYESDPQGFVSANYFANIVVQYRTDYSPLEVLHITQQIERDMGRTTKSVNGQYHDRIMDIDLLLCYDGEGNEIHINHPELTLPHPRMRERDFVWIPLKEIYSSLE